jgi:predicted HTH domain antitoxin
LLRGNARKAAGSRARARWPSLPFGPGERERHLQIELACRFYASGWLTLGMGARVAGLDQYAFGAALAERGIPRQYGLTEAQEDLAHARL